MHSIPTSSRNTDSRWARYAARYGEGPLVVVLMIALVTVASFSVQLGEWKNLMVPVGVTGVLGAIAGILLAKARVSDAMAQFSSFGLGLLVSGALLLNNAEMFGDRLIHRVRPFITFVMDWYLGRQESDDQQYLLVSFLLGLLVWMFGFLATWSLFRRGWLMVGLLLPAALALINLRYAPTTYPWTLGLMVALAIPISARVHFYQRERRWARRRMASPIGLGGRFVIVGTVLGLLVTLVSAQTPAAWSHLTFQPLIEEIGTTYQNAQEQAGAWLQGLAGSEGERMTDAGSYSAFDDAFSIGGPLNLTDQPEVLVQTNASQAPYLTAHTYDQYTGRGWASSTRETFGEVQADGGRLAPELLFENGQEVVLTDDVTGSRVTQSTTITPLSGPSGVVFSVDTYLTADIQTVVRMSWQRLDEEPFTITTDTLNTLPPDIQKIGNLLLQAELSASSSDWGPDATSPTMQQEINQEVDALAGRGILIRWDATTDGIIQNVYITGRLPVFDDVEAVFPRNALDSQASDSYQVRSLTSTATPEDLAAAPTTYPDWVAERYLETGDTVTDRTTELAMDVVGDAADPYTQAARIEAFLREHIVYDEMVEAPPEGSDLVDFVLFDNQRGYCEHYSAAMTVMMRSLGVPARTVVGYYPGDYDDAQGGYLYRQYNAHAWTEVFFPGYGWIPFEPTANRPLEERDSTVAGEATEMPVPTQAVPTPDVSDENTLSTPVPDNRTVDNPGPPQPLVVSEEEEGGLPGWLMPFTLGVVGVTLAGGTILLAWNWKLRGMTPIEALFAKTKRVGRLGGVHTGPTTTPREYATRFSEKMPGMSTPVRRIAQVYESDQFGPGGADARSMESARAAWRDVRKRTVRMLVRIRRKRS